MSWVTIIWSMSASACLTLAGLHLLVWCKKRTAWANLLFALAAMGTAAWTFCELWMMQADTPVEFATVLKWGHVAVCLMVVSLVVFVWLFLRAGRPWLAWMVCGLRILLLFPNFLVGQNLSFREITRLGHMRLLGESVAIAEGVPNPWILLAQLSLVMLIIFLADATVTTWRRGDRHRALAVGGSIVFFALVATGQSLLVFYGIVRLPYVGSVFFIGSIAVMGYELSRDVLRAAQLSDDLRESEERMTVASEAAGFGVWMWDIAPNQVWGSQRWLGLFGLDPDEAVTFETIIGRIHPDDREMVEREVRRAVENRGDYAGEYRVLLPDGPQRWIAARGRMYPGVNGKPARMLGAALDITERKEMELQLQSRFHEIEELEKQLEQENVYLRAETKLLYHHTKFVGESAALKQVLNLVEQVAPTHSTVLILGETGTGKELIAHAIHDLSSRKDRVMVKVNCAALPASLVESELFGREAGAYTGAMTKQIGRFELANGSTLFLDEISELPLELQAKLLRVLQEGEFERLGNPKTIRVDVRLITATNRNLWEEVQKGKFREDLYYRLKVFPIEVPPLRKRPEDIPALVWYFMEEFSRNMGKDIHRIPQGAMKALQGYHWPGNVRELRNLVEQCFIISNGDTLKVHLPQQPSNEAPTALTLAESEAQHILNALKRSLWRIKGPKGAAQLLGLNPSTLYTKMKKLGIPIQRTKDGIPS